MKIIVSVYDNFRWDNNTYANEKKGIANYPNNERSADCLNAGKKLIIKHTITGTVH